MRRRLLLVFAAVLLLIGCAPNREALRRAQHLAVEQRDTTLTCHQDDACALASPLRRLGDEASQASTSGRERNYVLLLDRGEDALLARVNLIRSARQSIELQSFIFAEDDAGFLMLDELLAAARRGVHVRVLLDQLYAVGDTRLLARLAAEHVNFELRLFNPTFGRAKTNALQFVGGILCCFTRFNQRMHNKLLLVDGRVGITGGRNIENRYFDWDRTFNYRDRDVLVAGPAALQMQASFETFWRYRKAVPVARLRDVARWLLKPSNEPFPEPHIERADRLLDLSAQADSAALVQSRLAADALPVGAVSYVSDGPGKDSDGSHRALATQSLRGRVDAAQDNIVMQTPYLVLSRAAKDLFHGLHEREDPPRVIVSTNSLASTDAFPVYALSHKYKRSYLRKYGFQIHEYKPFPADAPIDISSTGVTLDDLREMTPSESRRAFGSASRFGSASGSGSGSYRGPVPLERAGVRMGLHAKSLVIDDRIAVIGSHNFDPRSDSLNTEAVVIVHDAAVAARLKASILRDIQPENAWTIARRDSTPILGGVNYNLGKVFEKLPLFDFWPWRYATSYEIKPGCEPLPPDDPGFRACYDPVGDFPEVKLKPKAIYTRILTAFGAGLAPVL
ncbi:MAG: phospholipase D family protein [Lysobacteraceae bacterium]|nr:phospholipase D family protein [Xanthomonadales bacterium]HPF72424.1 phospholipase D family protein [Xanthomonadaceae bacterium]HRX99033.1 phospholipase D family protein [Xanthomonadaceae bacterium]